MYVWSTFFIFIISVFGKSTETFRVCFFLVCLILEDWIEGGPETSSRNCHSAQRKVPKESRFLCFLFSRPFVQNIFCRDMARRCLLEIRIDTHLKCPLLLCGIWSGNFLIQGFTIKFWTVPWFRRLAAILWLRRPLFNPLARSCDIFDGQSGTATGFSSNTSLFLCRHHRTSSSHSHFILVPPVVVGRVAQSV